MEDIGEFYGKACFAPSRAPAAIDFSQQASNKFNQRHFGCVAKEFRRDKLIPWFFQAKTGQHSAKLRQITRAEREKLALHENQRQPTDGPVFAGYAARGSQQELEKLAIIVGVDQKTACEPQNGISILKIPPDGGSYFCRNGASVLRTIQFPKCSSR